METENLFKSKSSRIILGIIIFFSAIMLAKFGYQFGQWLHQFIN